MPGKCIIEAVVPHHSIHDKCTISYMRMNIELKDYNVQRIPKLNVDITKELCTILRVRKLNVQKKRLYRKIIMHSIQKRQQQQP